MDVDHPERDQQWDHRERGETELERLDRNWASLLQELRVVQTGVQLLTGFLLTLPFQAAGIASRSWCRRRTVAPTAGSCCWASP